MLLKLHHTKSILSGFIQITGSKSETNRLLILKALFEGISLKNSSNSDDARMMQRALLSQDKVIDIQHAGTAMRFLTAYFSIQEGRETLLTGSTRMQERPIAILVDALQQLGAIITYTKKEGFPPIEIRGKKLTKNVITLKANVSSQYISALMMMGATLDNGLTIHLDGEITSIPYIHMTLGLLRQIDVNASFKEQTIHISSKRKSDEPREISVESDWSSASYFYSIVALSRKRNLNTSITIESYKEDSLQGDAVLQDIYKQLGVTSTFHNDQLILTSTSDFVLPKTITLDLVRSPDIAQTIAVTCLGLGIGCHLTGLHTLKIKETDRLEALKQEITKLGGGVIVTSSDLTLLPQSASLHENVTIATYHDHRMAMAFAPLSLHTPLFIDDAGVVSKSYPDFWKDLETLGFTQEIIA